jgi:type I restriction enzyme R subunit
LTLTESEVEEATLTWLASLGYTSVFGPDIAPEEPAAEHESFQSITSEL